MKRILALAACALLLYAVPSSAFEPGTRMDGIEITLAPGYVIPLWTGYAGWGRNETSGGISFNARAYFGSFIIADEYELDYGAEIGYLPLYSWDYSDTIGGDDFTYSTSYSVIPIIGQVRYRFGEPGDESYWYATSGLGFFMHRWSWEQPVRKGDIFTGITWEQDSGTETSTGLGLTASFGYKAGMFDFNGRWTSRWPAFNITAGISF